MKYLLPLLLLIGIMGCETADPDSSPLYGALSASRISLPNGWALSPVGDVTPLGDFPINMAVSSDESLLAVLHSGQSDQWIGLFETISGTRLDSVPLQKCWLGLCFSPDDQSLFVSGGNDNRIYEYAVSQQELRLKDSIVIGNPWPDDKISVAGIAVSADFVAAVTKEDSALYIFSRSGELIDREALGTEGYTCVPWKDRFVVSLWGGKQIGIYDPLQKAITSRIDVGSHPNDMVIDHDEQFLYVANANENSVSVVDLVAGQEVERLLTAPSEDSPAGSTPNGLCLTAKKQLMVAQADNNCLSVFDVSEPGESRALGMIPTGWYPTSVRLANGQIWVSSGKGETSLANPGGPVPGVPSDEKTEYIGGLFRGTLRWFNPPSEDTLKVYTRLAEENNAYLNRTEDFDLPEGHPIPGKLGDPSPIKYVFYVIKENRTYDQVFGDIEEGNGDPSLCLFPDSVTPNQHALAREFVLLDNFYVNAEVSADGHNWTLAAYANDYTEKTWPTSYGGRGGTYDYEGNREIAFPDDGFLWDNCLRNQVSFRSYGEFVWGDSVPYAPIRPYVAKDYPGYSLKIMDTTRIRLWQQDFDSLLAINQIPSLNVVRLGNDHTAGAREGYPTPAAMVADNDLAVGLLVSHISQSSIWDQTAIFILEDDAQNGPDHVDAHRSTALVISPFTKRNSLDHNMYSTASMLRTIELILGLPPMSQYDAAAPPMYACFSPALISQPFHVLPANIPLDQMNPERTALSEAMKDWDLSKEDAAPDIRFNQVIWKTVRGEESSMPVPIRRIWVRGEIETED